MTWRHYLLLLFISMTVIAIVAGYEAVPGYMDAEYYYMGGLQLAEGEGFVEPVIWNYLDDPPGIPHPSHAYWMPLASIIAAAGMKVAGSNNFDAARVGFILLAAFIPLVTAALANQITHNKRWAFISGLLAVFSGFYLPFITTTDTFPIYMVLGGILFILLPKFVSQIGFPVFFTGIIIGLLHISRADGIIWLIVFILVIFFSNKTKAVSQTRRKNLIFFLFGYSLVMVPWIYRNLSVFGTFLSPGGVRTVWLTGYNQLFSYPATQLTFQNWWSSGVIEILKARFWALGINLQRTLAEQGLIFLTPLIILGLWRFRSDVRIQTGFWVWVLTYGLMTFVFPFAGARGGLFHSCAALQPLFWAVTPLGLSTFIEWGGRKRGWKQEQATLVFGVAMIALAALLSGTLYYQRVVGPEPYDPLWDQSNTRYRAVEGELQNLGASKDDVVMVKNPPGYYIANNRNAIVVPDGDMETLLSVATRYGAQYILLDQDHPEGLTRLYRDFQKPPFELQYLNTIYDTHIFKVK
jgi:hypothetical protein